jgi:hypothetical protein
MIPQDFRDWWVGSKNILSLGGHGYIFMSRKEVYRKLIIVQQYLLPVSSHFYGTNTFFCSIDVGLGHVPFFDQRNVLQVEI